MRNLRKNLKFFKEFWEKFQEKLSKNFKRIFEKFWNYFTEILGKLRADLTWERPLRSGRFEKTCEMTRNFCKVLEKFCKFVTITKEKLYWRLWEEVVRNFEEHLVQFCIWLNKNIFKNLRRNFSQNSAKFYAIFTRNQFNNNSNFFLNLIKFLLKNVEK